MYSAKSYQLTVEEYNYLLPAIRTKLLYSNERHYFVGTFDEVFDMLNRLKGLYDNYNEINSTIIYECCKSGSLESFRTLVLTNN